MIWAYDKKLGRVHPTRIENTGGQGNFYSVRRGNGELDDQIDEHLQNVESRAADPYERLIRGEELREQARADFASFLATLYVRSPGMIRSAAEANGKMMQAFMDLHWHDRDAFDRSLDKMGADGIGDPGMDRDRLYEFWKQKDFSLAVLEQSGLLGLGAADPIQEILFDRPWRILETESARFITGDQAVTLWNPPRPPLSIGGFADPAAEVSFPLNPTQCLLITGRHLPFRRTLVAEPAVWQLNELRAFEAERLLWSSTRDERVLALALKHQASRRRFRMSGEEHLAEVEVKRNLD